MAPRKKRGVRKKPEPKPLSATVIKPLQRKANNSSENTRNITKQENNKTKKHNKNKENQTKQKNTQKTH